MKDYNHKWLLPIPLFLIVLVLSPAAGNLFYHYGLGYFGFAGSDEGGGLFLSGLLIGVGGVLFGAAGIAGCLLKSGVIVYAP